MQLVRRINAILVIVIEGLFLYTSLAEPFSLPDSKYGFFSPYVSIAAIILAIVQQLILFAHKCRERNFFRILIILIDIYFAFYWLLQVRTCISVYTQ